MSITAVILAYACKLVHYDKVISTGSITIDFIPCGLPEMPLLHYKPENASTEQTRPNNSQLGSLKAITLTPLQRFHRDFQVANEHSSMFWSQSLMFEIGIHMFSLTELVQTLSAV